MREVREARDFVRELCFAGRSPEQVRAVARATRWENKMADVAGLLEARGRLWRQAGREARQAAGQVRKYKKV